MYRFTSSLQAGRFKPSPDFTLDMIRRAHASQNNGLSTCAVVAGAVAFTRLGEFGKTRNEQ